MSSIRILPETLSNKIAAGEVVERPASVVKELVENALDAGATRVKIEVEKGGRSLVRVSDNGGGMEPDDALLALERYATSKIQHDGDLFAIRTLGFRGEALPSIAAVSRLRLVTRATGADAGCEIIVDGGRIKKVRATGAPAGTLVSVNQLFFNTPARRKFLKTIGTEMGHIADTVAGIALGRPQVRFELTHNGRTVKNWPASPAPLDRAVDVLGADLQQTLQPLQLESDALALSGWISAPAVSRSTTHGIYTYVNGRCVRDRLVRHALLQGYAQRLVKGRFPVAVLYMRLPWDQVDVNVHPTKNEVRFARPHQVHEAVQSAVVRALQGAGRPGWTTAASSATAGRPRPEQVAETAAGRRPWPGSQQRPASKPQDWHWQPAETRAPADSEAAAGGRRAPAVFAGQPRRDALWPGGRFADLRVIGQFRNAYIVCEAARDLIVIDQHAAHERIVFEQLRRRAAAGRPAVQGLLVPATVELGFREAHALEKMMPELMRLGLDIEPFGGTSFVVKAVPALLADRPIAPLVVQIAEELVVFGTSAGLAAALDRCRMLMACHGAVRAHQALSAAQIKALLGQLDECENPLHCPHGRPTWLRWDLAALEKAFKRVN